MRGVFIALAVLFGVMCMVEGRVSYTNYRLIEVVVHNEVEREFLESLPEDRGEVRGIDVWSNDGIIIADGQTVNRVMLSPAGYKAMVKSGLFGHAKVITHNVEQRLAELNVLDAKPMSERNVRDDVYDPADDWFYHWHTYDEMQEHLQVVANNHSSNMKYFTIGESQEGRKIGMLHIHGRNPTRSVALIGGTHAREWIADAVLLWFIGCVNELYDTDRNLTDILDSIDLYVCPCYNPDGYVYAHDVDRLWRKNRRNNGDGTFGVDQNRNWDVDWCHTFSSHDPSTLIYCGPSAFSEPETTAMHNFLKSLPNLSLTVDFHSPQKGFLRPFAYTNDTCPDEKDFERVGFNFIKNVYYVHGTVYNNIPASRIYVFSGGCVDAAYLLGSRRAFELELFGPDFVLPESEIQKQGEEIFVGLRYLLTEE